MSDPKTPLPTHTVDAIPSDYPQALFLGNPAVDNLVSVVIAMGAELWATQRRMKVVEALLAKQGITPAMIEQYAPSDAEKAAWERDRDRFVDLTLGALADEGHRTAGSKFDPR